MQSKNNNPLIQTYYRLLADVGKATLHNMFPNDFEYYMCSFELVDSNNKTVDFLIFPVNPNTISETKAFTSNIQRTASGIKVNKNLTFVPRNIQISGNFGRNFKFLIGREDLVDFNSILTSFDTNQRPFSKSIKTGYGTTKVLESILEKSSLLDENGRQFKLYFYNQGFGTSYIVEINNMSFSQDMSNNMIWNYNITMTGVAPLNSQTKGQDTMSLKDMSTKNIITKGINNLYNYVKASL